jgi:hypothetical protein
MGLEIEEVTTGASLSMETSPPTEKYSAFNEIQSIKPRV